jgi:hypothetical protein
MECARGVLVLAMPLTLMLTLRPETRRQMW